jgi:hypothetical protein
MDAIVGVMCARAGLEVQVSPILRVSDGADGMDFVLKALPTLASARREMSAAVLIEESFISRGVNLVQLPNLPSCAGAQYIEDIEDSVTWCIDRAGAWGGGPKAPRAPILDDVFVSGTGYFGNEAGQGTIYVSTVLLVHVPEATERDLNSLSVEDAPVVRAGLSADEEEKAAQEKLRVFDADRSNKWITREDLLPLARDCGVSTTGTMNEVGRRIQQAAVAAQRASWERDGYFF